ncbi:MAG: tetratricopeptide repeat-containing protein [Sphingomonadaceae bacterium]
MIPSPRAQALPAIITAARAGALGHAWSLFESAGLGALAGDPGALAVKGRLLKDRALASAADQRVTLFADAASAYAAADALVPQPYTAINVATLTLLAGAPERAAEIATALLAWMETAPDIAETPYYMAATRAEAELLRGDRLAAQAWLGTAIEHDPAGWADHASTLRQCGLILAAQGKDADWLDRFRPPRSMHYAGHLAIAADEHRALTDGVMTEIDRAGVGFGYGALAAGSDIVIAETLIRAGAALHVILPTAVDTFVAQSVAPYGADWTRRFDACLAAATDVRAATSASGGYEPVATGLAADLAMGAAVLNAHLLESSALQLLVVDDGPGRYGEGRGTARDGERWAQSGREQNVLVAPRTTPVVASARRAPEGRPDRRLAAMLHIALAGVDTLDDGGFAEALDSAIAPLHDLLHASSIRPDLTLPVGNARIVAFEAPEAAWAYAAPLLASATAEYPLRIAAHYGLVHRLADPAAIVGRSVTELLQIAHAALPGTLTASESFATALMTGSGRPPRAEPIGEVEAIRLFALAARTDQ